MTRRNITADFKFKVILETLKERKIWKKYILDPSSGSRRITGTLNRDGLNVQRGLLRRLMREMNLKGLTPKRK